MARLLIKTGGPHLRPLLLKLGRNRIGRDEENDFQIEHPSISATHCEILLADDSVAVRDCDSTNGTFIDGQRIKEGALRAGQVLQLGSVELLVETTEVRIAIPHIETPAPPPLRLPDGSLPCLTHPALVAVYQCAHCQRSFCAGCIHRLRRRGGKPWKLCAVCSGQCMPLAMTAGRKSFLTRLRETLKLPFKQ